MAIPSRQIGWSTEDNLLWQISKQLEQLTNVTAKTCTNNTSTYKVYTALLTQSGGDAVFGQNGGTAVGYSPELTIGVTYYISDNFQMECDFTNVGAPNNEVGTYFVATGTTPNTWGTYGNLIFNTGAPVATVLENTIGNIWFTYNGVGTYSVVSNGLFIVDKSLSIIGTPLEGVQNNNFAGINYSGDSEFRINVVQPAGVSLDDLLYQTPIEIRVYN